MFTFQQLSIFLLHNWREGRQNLQRHSVCVFVTPAQATPPPRGSRKPCHGRGKSREGAFPADPPEFSSRRRNRTASPVDPPPDTQNRQEKKQREKKKVDRNREKTESDGGVSSRNKATKKKKTALEPESERPRCAASSARSVRGMLRNQTRFRYHRVIPRAETTDQAMHAPVSHRETSGGGKSNQYSTVTTFLPRRLHQTNRTTSNGT